jgi:hypothetical protein
MAQVLAVLVLASTGTGLLLTTDIYEDIYETIVATTCYSCIKMDPLPNLQFTFETANGDPHPNFILENLTMGPVFLGYRLDVCAACDIMDPLVQDVFGVTFEMDELFYESVDFDGSTVHFFHINLDHATGAFKDSFSVYGSKGVPLFVIISLDNNSGIIEPAYAIAEATLGLPTNEGRKIFLQTMVEEALIRYSAYRDDYTSTV